MRNGAGADRERVVASETQRLLSCTTAMAMGQPLRTKYSDALAGREAVVRAGRGEELKKSAKNSASKISALRT
jgi:hypothetical protein